MVFSDEYEKRSNENKELSRKAEERQNFQRQLKNFSKTKSKKKTIDERAIAKKVLKDYQESAEYKKNIDKIRRLERQQRYEKTSAGKIGRGIAKGVQFARRPTATAYASQMPVNFSKRPRKVRQLPKTTSRSISQKKVVRLTPGQVRYIQEFNRVFMPRDETAFQLERELINQSGGVSAEGDQVAFSMEPEILHHGNSMMILPTANIERETLFHGFEGDRTAFNFSNMFSQKPRISKRGKRIVNPSITSIMEDQVNFFSNLLN